MKKITKYKDCKRFVGGISKVDKIDIVFISNLEENSIAKMFITL